MSQKPIILWDMMETLVTEPYFTHLPGFFGMSVEELKRQMHPTSWIAFEEGRISEAEYYESFFLDRRTIDAERLRACIRESYQWLTGMEDLVKELRSLGYEMHALSNYSAWYLLIEESLGMSRYVAWTFVSCLTGLRKPGAETYWHAVRTLGVRPQDCFFVDDRPVNVRAARDIGMEALVKADTGQLRRQFRQRGIAVGES